MAAVFASVYRPVLISKSGGANQWTGLLLWPRPCSHNTQSRSSATRLLRCRHRQDAIAGERSRRDQSGSNAVGERRRQQQALSLAPWPFESEQLEAGCRVHQNAEDAVW